MAGSRWMIICVILIISLSLVYFYLYTRRHERYILLWSYAWLVYALSVICVILYDETGIQVFIVAMKLVEVLNILLLLLGTYAYIHVKVPSYWYRITLYLIVLVAICSVYDVYTKSVFVPLSVYQLVLTAFICLNVGKMWEASKSEKIIPSIAFFVWGVGNAVLSIFEMYVDDNSGIVFSEFALFVLVGFGLFAIILIRTGNAAVLSDSIYKRVVDGSADAIFYYRLTPYHAFEYISPAIEKITGYGREYFYNDPMFLEEISVEQHLELIEKSLDVNHEDNEDLSFQIVTKEGKERWVYISSTPVWNSKDQLTAIQGSIRDIDGLKNSEIRMVEQYRERGEMFTYLSHEIRTPITSIAGYTEAILDGTFSTREEKLAAMEVISAKASTLKKLVEDVDQLTKLEAGKFKFDFEAYNVSEIAEMLIASNLGHIENSGFEVEVNADLKGLERYWIIADSDRLQQVQMNLINNAIKYSDDRKKIIMSFSVDEAERNLVVSVTDQGTGIKADDLSKVFDRFYRTAYHKEREGKGLGLALCKNIIENHQGNMFVQSVYGEGSTFTYIIPLFKEN